VGGEGVQSGVKVTEPGRKETGQCAEAKRVHAGHGHPAAAHPSEERPRAHALRLRHGPTPHPLPNLECGHDWALALAGCEDARPRARASVRQQHKIRNLLQRELGAWEGG
jgi:hypothetical protein